MGCDYWKILTVTIEYMQNHKLKTVEKEFSIEPCYFYDIELTISNSLENDEATIERTHRIRVLKRIQMTPIPEPIMLFNAGHWNNEKYRARVENIIDCENIQNIKTILLKTSFECAL